jgi:hypothetical protein
MLMKGRARVFETVLNGSRRAANAGAGKLEWRRENA